MKTRGLSCVAIAAAALMMSLPVLASDLPNSKWSWGDTVTTTSSEPVGDVYTQGAAHSASTFQDYEVTTTKITQALNPAGKVVNGKSLVTSSTEIVKVKVK